MTPKRAHARATYSQGPRKVPEVPGSARFCPVDLRQSPLELSAGVPEVPASPKVPGVPEVPEHVFARQRRFLGTSGTSGTFEGGNSVVSAYACSSSFAQVTVLRGFYDRQR